MLLKDYRRQLTICAFDCYSTTKNQPNFRALFSASFFSLVILQFWLFPGSQPPMSVSP